MIDCPCNSGKIFSDCCEPIISKECASTALALMRSRYTAYHNGHAAYLYSTTHPKTRVESSLSEIEEWSKQNKWTKLEIIEYEKGTQKDTSGIVEFKAYYRDKNGVDQIHYEKSTFIKENEKWFYLEGIANPQKATASKRVSRNDPCPCGSGKKYKKCCA